MAASYVHDRPYLPQSRVSNLTLPDLVVCPLCDGVLWLPVACRECEKPFCTACVDAWHIEQADSSLCPNLCGTYVQRSCPPANLHILKTLQVTCRYSPNGCTKTLAYDNLQAHEQNCGYQLITCSGCEEQIVKKDFDAHHATCPLVLLACSACQSTYQRREESEHTEIVCLRVQLHQVRDRAEQQEREYKDRFSSLQIQVEALADIIRGL